MARRIPNVLAPDENNYRGVTMNWSININKKTPADSVIEQTRRAVGWLKGPRQSEFPDMIDAVVNDIAGINLNFPDERKKEFVELVGQPLTQDQFNDVIARITRRVSASRPQFATFRDMFVERRDRESKAWTELGETKKLDPYMWEKYKEYVVGPKPKPKKGGKTRKTKRRRHTTRRR